MQPTDPQALALTHSIALQESGNGGMTPNYNATGDAGTSKGAYQWQPGNFEAAAKNAGLDPNDFSPQNQDKVAYSEIKAYKDKGYDPGQIASLWNSGSPNNWQNHSGTTTINGKEISYDTPAYVNGVKSYYQKLTGGSSQNQNDSNQTSEQPKTFASSVPDVPPTKPHTVAGNLIRGLINGSGVPSLAASGINLVQAIEGKPETDTFHSGYLGNISRVGKNFDPAQGLSSQNLGAVADAAGKGVSLATIASGGEGAAGKITGLLDGSLLEGSSALTSPAVENAMKGFDLPMSQFKTLSAGDQLEYLSQALPKAGVADKAVLQQVIDKITPQAISEAGGKVAFSQLHPTLAKIPSIVKTLSGLGTTVGLVDVLNKLNKK